jgi:Uma2 family endonuclease
MSAVLIENSLTIREDFPVVELELGNVLKNLEPDEFFEFCQTNRDWRIERDKDGQIIIMTPTGWNTGNKNLEISRQLGNWTKKDGRGRSADSSAGYELPNGAIVSPDASWILKDRLAALGPEQLEKFLPLAPDFVIELRSGSDSRERLRRKMVQYIENGVSIAWLIDPIESKAYVYGPGNDVQILEKPASLSGEPFLPGFVLDMKEIW